MTDRELLEAAAKAAGITIPRFVDQVTDYDSPHYGISAVQIGSSWETWNPLEDDGDALRLAVKLRLSVTLHNTAVFTCRNEDESTQLIQFSDDPYAATRRAIVRAAAMIGGAK